MKKMFVAVAFLVVAVCALTVVNFAYDTNPTVVAGSETANYIASSSADNYTNDRQDFPVGLNEENQYDILADNHLYGHDDYGDYVPAETRYVNGFPVVNGEKTYDKYYGTDGYIYPGEEEKSREEWNLHDFHKNGEYFESVGKGEMHFYNEEDMKAYAQQLRDEFGAENVHEVKLDSNGDVVAPPPTSASGSGNSITDTAENTVDDVNQRQEDILNSADNG